MLIGDFFTIEETKRQENETLYLTTLNEKHKIYNGHFPGDPICPGVCNIQTIRECAELQLGKKLLIKNIALCRFSALIKPQDTPKLLISIQLSEKEDGVYLATAKITSPDAQNLFLEYKGEYCVA